MKKIWRRLSASVAAGSMTAALSVTFLTTSPAHADGAASCTDTSSKGGVISPCMMIARANNWIAAGVPYDQGGWYASPSGDGTYREDCAGFVAMAWHMQWSPPVTYSPPGLDDPSISKYLGTVSSLKSAGSLGTIQPGDALVLTGEHVVLFAGWTDSSHTAAVIDSESHTGVPTSQAGGINAWGTQYLIDQGYKVYRYNNDQLNNPTSPPTTTVDSGTVTSSAVTLTGTAAPAADAFYFHIQQNGVDKLYSPAVAGTPGTTHHTWSFDPKSLPNGTYQAIASATLNGQIGTSAPYNITINNGPVAPVAPTVNRPTGVPAAVTALTASAPGATSVTYSVDGKVVGTSTSGPDFSLEWNTTAFTDGLHAVTATAGNSGGTSPASAPLTLDVVNGGNAQSVITLNGTTIVYELGGDGHVYENYNSGSGWSGKQMIANQPSGVSFISAPVATVNSTSGQVDVHVTGSDGNVYEDYAPAGGNWSGWVSLGQPGSSGGSGALGAPVTFINGNTFFVYVLAADGHIYENYNTTTWSGWQMIANQPAGVSFVSSPAVTVNSATGQVDVHTTGSDGNIYENYAPAGGNWSGWVSLGRPGSSGGSGALGAPVTFINGNTFFVYVVAADGHMYENYNTTTWSGWQMIANQPASVSFISSPAVTVNSTTGQVDVHATGSDGNIYENYAPAGGAWTGWVSLGQPGSNAGSGAVGAPVTFISGNTFFVYVLCQDGNVYEDYNATTWSGWQMQPGATGLTSV